MIGGADKKLILDSKVKVRLEKRKRTDPQINYLQNLLSYIHCHKPCLNDLQTLKLKWSYLIANPLALLCLNKGLYLTVIYFFVDLGVNLGVKLKGGCLKCCLK